MPDAEVTVGGLPAGEHLSVDADQIAGGGGVLEGVPEHALPLGEGMVLRGDDELAVVVGDGQAVRVGSQVEDRVALVGLQPGGQPAEVLLGDGGGPGVGLFADLRAGRGEGVPVGGEGVDVDAVALEADAVDGRHRVVDADVRAGLPDQPL